MSYFSYKDVYVENGKMVLEVNILPEKYCNFDCIFCPVGRSQNKADSQKSFGDIDSSLIELACMIEHTKAELIFINSKGESLLNDKINEVVAFIKGKGLSVRLFSNGYLLGKDEYRQIANMCDEVVGEIKITTEEHFQKAQRPVNGYTLSKYVSNMSDFNKQFGGRFIFEITIIKGYNDNDESIYKIKDILRKISPDKTIITRIEDERFTKKLGIPDERFAEISNAILCVTHE